MYLGIQSLCFKKSGNLSNSLSGDWNHKRLGWHKQVFAGTQVCGGTAEVILPLSIYVQWLLVTTAFSLYYIMYKCLFLMTSNKGGWKSSFIFGVRIVASKSWPREYYIRFAEEWRLKRRFQTNQPTRSTFEVGILGIGTTATNYVT